MFQAGDAASFKIKSSDKLRVVGVYGQDHFDRHFAFGEHLAGLVDCAKSASSDHVPQFIPWGGFTWCFFSFGKHIRFPNCPGEDIFVEGFCALQRVYAKFFL